MPLYTYKPSVGVAASHGNYADGVSGFNRGVQAISSDGNLIAQDTHIYDGDLKYKLNISNVNSAVYNPSGLSFSGDSKYLYFLNAYDSKIFQLSAADWSIEKVFSLGFAVVDQGGYLGGAYGNRLSLSADGKYLLVLGQKTLAAVNLQTVVADGGTDKANQIFGDAANESLAGYAGNDLIDGGAGADTLLGGDGDDTLIGGLGNDKLDGGLGVDTASYASAPVSVVVELGATYGQTASGEGYDSLESIENVTGSAFADRLLGDRFANVLAGGDGADTLLGGGGGDTLQGGADSDVLQGQDGDDVLDGGGGIDFASYESASLAVIIDLSSLDIQNTRGDGLDRLQNIEGVIGSGFDDVLTGSNAANTLRGGGGGDTLNGGAGADILSGDAGDDVLDGGADGDTASYATAAVGVTVDLGLTGAQDTRGAGLDRLLNIEGLTGSQFGDSLKGGEGRDTIAAGGGGDFVDGGRGADLVQGESGEDTLWGGDGNDSIEGGADFDQLNGNVGDDTARGGEGNDWVVGGRDQDLLYGENGFDVVYGNLGNDTCYGGEDADWVRGGQGDDVIDGGAGNDWMAGDRGNDTVTGGAGADKFYFFAGAAIDRVTDFSSAAGDRVLLDVGQAYTLSYSADGAVVSLGGGDQMILVGITAQTIGEWLLH
jgi:Ca2+-binding RTX toxin-like protein